MGDLLEAWKRSQSLQDSPRAALAAGDRTLKRFYALIGPEHLALVEALDAKGWTHIQLRGAMSVSDSTARTAFLRELAALSRPLSSRAVQDQVSARFPPSENRRRVNAGRRPRTDNVVSAAASLNIGAVKLLRIATALAAELEKKRGKVAEQQRVHVAILINNLRTVVAESDQLRAKVDSQATGVAHEPPVRDLG